MRTILKIMKQAAASGGDTEAECLGLQSVRMLSVRIARI